MPRTPTQAPGLVRWARPVLVAAEGMANYEIAERVGVTRPTVTLWRNRYTKQGLAGLAGEASVPAQAAQLRQTVTMSGKKTIEVVYT